VVSSGVGVASWVVEGRVVVYLVGVSRRS